MAEMIREMLPQARSSQTFHWEMLAQVMLHVEPADIQVSYMATTRVKLTGIIQTRLSILNVVMELF